MSVVSVREDGPVTIVSINRPEKGNAISKQVAIEIQDAVKAFDKSDQRVCVIASVGDKFSVGADLTDMPELWRCIPTLGAATDKPLIAAVTGWCVGGALVIVQMADLAVATENSRFYYPEAKVGFTGGIIAGLAGRIPHKIAMELIMLGGPISAQRAYEAGLINRVVPDGKHVDEAVAMAKQLAEFSPVVLKALKRFVVQHVLPEGPSEAMARQMIALNAVRDSEDGQEAGRAFKEKRPAKFPGR